MLKRRGDEKNFTPCIMKPFSYFFLFVVISCFRVLHNNINCDMSVSIIVAVVQ